MNRQAVSGCNIVDVGKRRDGGTRFWCLAHQADATAKYGVRAAVCRRANLPPLTDQDVLDLEVENYGGGVGLWGAAPPIYDTTRRKYERGVHLHARKAPGGEKVIDGTYRAVRVHQGGCAGLITDLDALYYMVSAMFDMPLDEVRCGHCGHSHLDKDWFSVHPHRRHLCEGCGKYFRDDKTAIGNPVVALRRRLGLPKPPLVSAVQSLRISQSDYAGGIQIWGSNRSLLWTSGRAEQSGIHLHAWASDRDEKPVVDETFSEVVVDGVALDAESVRWLMAQSALPHLNRRVVSAQCPNCDAEQRAVGEARYNANTKHVCQQCRRSFTVKGRLKKVVLNPLPRALSLLALQAPRHPQRHDLGLLAETL